MPNDTSAPAEVVQAVEVLGEHLFALSAQLKASGFLASDPHHAVYERVVAAFQTVDTAALNAQPLAADALDAVRICRDAAQWELAQAGKPGIGKKAADNHRSAAHALELAADEIAASSAVSVASALDAGTVALSQDVVRLIIAARHVAFDGMFDSSDEEERAQISELAQASEAFASRVPWEDEPEDEA